MLGKTKAKYKYNMIRAKYKYKYKSKYNMIRAKYKYKAKCMYNMIRASGNISPYSHLPLDWGLQYKLQTCDWPKRLYYVNINKHFWRKQVSFTA